MHYYHLDALGSVRAITDESGAVIERYDYLPYGEAWAAQPSSNPIRFTGKERDAETGLDYFGARYYRAHLCRFTTTDPVYTWRDNLTDPQRWNRYAYARNNPFRYVDPDGKETVLLQGRRTEGNLLGHIAIAINGELFSFGTDWTEGPPYVGDWGRDQVAYLTQQNNDRATDIITLNVSETQERALLKELQDNNPNARGAPKYNKLSNSCVTVCERALERSGILPNEPGPVTIDGAGNLMQAGAPKSFTPSGLVQRVKDTGLVKSTQRVGQEKASWIRSAIGTAKNLFQDNDD
jgi:RHS repeat-associated protein